MARAARLILRRLNGFGAGIAGPRLRGNGGSRTDLRRPGDRVAGVRGGFAGTVFTLAAGSGTIVATVPSPHP